MRNSFLIKIIVLSASCLAGGLAPAMAQANKAHLHLSTGTARESGASEIATVATAGPGAGCYASLSAADMARGIRYWTGKC